MEKKKCTKCGMVLDADMVYADDCEHCGDRGELLARSPVYAVVIKEFSLIRGYPQDPEGRASLDRAEKAIIKKRRAMVEKMGLSDNVEKNFRYNKDNLLQSDNWWYIPHVGIGFSGYIVNKSDNYVNSLGSYLFHTLSNSFWGHDRGIYCDLVDFTFATDTPLELVRRLARRFGSLTPNMDGRVPEAPRSYKESEIESVVAQQFPVFRNHLVWSATPEIRDACENEGLQFTATISELEMTFSPSGRETTQKRLTA